MNATTELKKDIESKLNNFHSLNSVRAYLIKNLDEYGTATLKYPDHGFRIFYTSNDNFQRGIKNGGGQGMYVSLKRTGFFQTFKLS